MQSYDKELKVKIRPFLILDFSFPTTPSDSHFHGERDGRKKASQCNNAAYSPPVQGGVRGGSLFHSKFYIPKLNIPMLSYTTLRIPASRIPVLHATRLIRE